MRPDSREGTRTEVNDYPRRDNREHGGKPSGNYIDKGNQTTLCIKKIGKNSDEEYKLDNMLTAEKEDGNNEADTGDEKSKLEQDDKSRFIDEEKSEEKVSTIKKGHIRLTVALATGNNYIP